jgi:hypothetical protein
MFILCPNMRTAPERSNVGHRMPQRWLAKTLLSGATTWSARAGAIAPSAHRASDKPMRPSEQRLMG